MSVIVCQFQTVRFIQMMSLTFGLFTQVSDSGPLGPLVMIHPLTFFPLSDPLPQAPSWKKNDPFLFVTKQHMRHSYTMYNHIISTLPPPGPTHTAIG